jgi:hypothetical protein
MSRKLLLLIFLVFLGQVLLVLPIKLSFGQPPSAATVGRYVVSEDKHWIVYNKTVQELKNEGYNVSGDLNWLLQVNYTRLDYTFRSAIVRLSWPNVTVESIEGRHDLNVTAFRINDNGTIGERAGSFLRANQPPRMRTWDSRDPHLGVMFNPSIFAVGYNFTYEDEMVFQYSVNRTELLNETKWGPTQTYVLYGDFINASHLLRNTVWCDATSGMMLKQIWDQSFPSYTSYEVQLATDIGIEEMIGVKPGDWASYGDTHLEWASNISGQEHPPADLNYSWSDVKVTDWLGSNITAQSTTIFRNGTELTQTYWGSILSGEGSLSFSFIPTNLNSGEEIPAPLMGLTPESLWLSVNETLIRSYAGADREVNHANVTYALMLNATQYGTMNMSFYWDKKTGFLCEYDFRSEQSYMVDSVCYYLNMSLSEKMTATNMWPAVFSVGDGYAFDVTMATNSSISEFIFNGSLMQISFRVTGPPGKPGYCNVTFPKGLLWGDFTLYKDTVQLTEGVDYIKTYNDTHYAFYITYTYCIHNIEIEGTEAVPEFASLIAIPLFLMATLLAVAVHRRRRSE